MLENVVQSNARLGLSDKLKVQLDHISLPAGNGKTVTKKKERSLDVLSAIKKSIVNVMAAFLCLAHALIILKAR